MGKILIRGVILGYFYSSKCLCFEEEDTICCLYFVM
jgi:hypothetical protein